MKPIGISLRAVCLADEPFLLSLRKLTMTGHLQNANQPTDDVEHMTRIRFHIDDARIIQCNAVDVGLLKAYRSEGCWVVLQVQVLPDHQKQGIGSEAIKTILAIAKREKVIVRLAVLKDNQARRLYERLGFVVNSETEIDYQMSCVPDQKLKMTDPISYRRATVDDILRICELGQILNAVHHQARPDIYSDATTDVARDKLHWLPNLQETDRATFVAEHAGKAVGFITVQLAIATNPILQPTVSGRIGSVAVAEEMRGRGVGTELMKLAEAWALEHGAADMRLAVWTFNQHAVDLYRELGYEVRAFEMGKRIHNSDEHLRAESR